jgi:hypothetical protein
LFWLPNHVFLYIAQGIQEAQKSGALGRISHWHKVNECPAGTNWGPVGPTSPEGHIPESHPFHQVLRLGGGGHDRLNLTF